MGRPIRHQDPSRFYFITNRTFQARFLLRPDEETNAILKGCLCRWASRYDVQFVSFVFMSNHFHFIARFPHCNMHDFMRDFQSDLARRINALRNRTGSVFPRRYSAEPILDDAALQDKILYTLNNPVKANLVTHLEHWPGISSLPFHETGETITGTWFNRSKYARLKRDDPDASREEAMETYELEMVPPPHLKELTHREAGARILQVFEARRIETRKRLANQYGDVLGAKKIVQRDWRGRPDSPKKTPRPYCHATSRQRRLQYRKFLRRLSDQYHGCVQRLRGAETDVEFPVGTIPPGWRVCVDATTYLSLNEKNRSAPAAQAATDDT